MVPLHRVFVYPAVYVVVLAPLAGIAWWWVAVSGCDLSGLAAQLEREDRRRALLDRQARAFSTSSEGKERVAKELIAGRMTLSEAAVHFRRLDEALREAGVPVLGRGRGEEAAWANVIIWVKELLKGDPSRAAPIGAALEAEFRSRFGHAPLPPSF